MLMREKGLINYCASSVPAEKEHSSPWSRLDTVSYKSSATNTDINDRRCSRIPTKISTRRGTTLTWTMPW
ncbi:hypothetical protein PBY51_016614 [Eleginops maclovinus]|uniref:Uncharacterized protein n=1 Tax=Eleginops maclovinus TaxID=56733 RepID=A0AAN7WQ84_ELEMC|nr:hypothetical protein PBY51_016614 [Eleginops maclovinus]